MTSEKRRKVLENIVYLVLWILTFTAPVVFILIRNAESAREFEWRELLGIWFAFVPYLVLFLIHNYLISRFFFIKGKRWLYFVLVAVLLAVHPGVSVVTKGKVPWNLTPPDAPVEVKPGQSPPPPGLWNIPIGKPPQELGERGSRPGEPIDIMGVAKIALALMMLALNLIIKWSYRTRIMEEKVMELEREKLRGQIKQLRYQINPHFFMNTLNNIHALVDIDPEMAKKTIIELSRLMRYVLYDSSDGEVSLEKEKTFLERYLNIMSIRYSDKVKIVSDFNCEGPAARVPSLLLVTFLENAFKHGVTYKKDSILDTSLRIKDGRIVFSCYNTKRQEENRQQGGIGLENATRRLNLIYSDTYTMQTTEDDQSYKVVLTLPLIPPVTLRGVPVGEE